MIDLESPTWFGERYRHYLRLVAQLHLGNWLQAKLDPSDLVQETFLKAHEHRQDFRGQTEAEWRAFLRQILKNVIADAIRHHTRDKRDVRHEEMLEHALEESSRRIEGLLVGTGPGKQVEREELLVRLAEALAQLPADERRALELRYLQNPPVPLAEIATQLGRPSAKAVGGLARPRPGEAPQHAEGVRVRR